jgi:lipoyl-dependent peroxiredoxin
MDAIKPLFTATATATGGRNGRTEASDGSVGVNLSVPKEKGGFGIAVNLRVEDGTLSQADLTMLANEAHEQICPYSHATRNNVPVELETKDA